MLINLVRQRLQTLFSHFLIPANMCSNGLLYLARLVNFVASDNSVLELQLSASVHVIGENDRCTSMVYLLCNGPGLFSVGPIRIRVDRATLLYAGQAENFRQRDSSRRGPMRGSGIKICLGHDLTQYQKDCLESIWINFLRCEYGVNCRNVSPYPRYIYTTQHPVDIDDRASHISHINMENIPTYGLLRRLLFVGTAPPNRISDSDYYRRLLDRHAQPLMDWEVEIDNSRSIRELRDIYLADVENDYLPGFINHFPDRSSERFDDMSRTLSTQEIRQYDANLRNRIEELHRTVIVFYGARPTHMVPFIQRWVFLSQVCSNVEIYWHARDSCGFIMWWPDLGLRNHASTVAQTRMDNIWTLLRYKMMLLLLRVNQYLADGEFGVTPSQANQIIEWLAGHPVSLHLKRLLVSLAQNWMSTNEEELETEWLLDLTTPPSEAVPNDVQDPDAPGMSYVLNPNLLQNENEEVGEGSASATNQPPLTTGSVAETIAGWAPGVVTQHWSQTLRRVPWLHTMSDEEQAAELRSTISIWVASTPQRGLANSIARGTFEPRQGETNEQQLARFQREVNMARIARNHRPDSTRLTCVYCNQVIQKVVTRNGSVVVRTQTEGCPNSDKIKLGWSLVSGVFEDIFPDENIFVLFARAQVPRSALNQNQLARDVAIYCLNNDWHPQVQHLMDVRYYPWWRSLMEVYAAGETPGSVKSGWITGVKEAMAKVAHTEPIYIIQRQKTRAEGYRPSRSESTNTMTVYAFRPESTAEHDILGLEQR
ncbi:hypothetical protein INT43_001725 [Umbelopsis isabellina]|uniref:Uncharacterized protein n=1 Tax=Mortierella isabellina TaxID=91625 RepID=A0A8H7PSS9_MORIS|nr:hypothetical protein INT43_001725 [Umbelopsis isabellina]